MPTPERIQAIKEELRRRGMTDEMIEQARTGQGATRPTAPQNPILRGLSGMVAAFPKIALEGKVPEAKTTEPDFYEKEIFKKRLEDIKGPRKVGIVNPLTGAVTETETDADVILKGIVEKSPEELTSSDLKNLEQILLTEPMGEEEITGGGRFGFGRKRTRKYTPEQEAIRKRARELLQIAETTGVTAPIAQPGATQEKSPYPDYPDAFLEEGIWKVIREGKKYKIQE
jgi:hypothetical protein